MTSRITPYATAIVIFISMSLGAQENDNADVASQGTQNKPVENQIQMQGENTVLADNLLGQPVFSQNKEEIGDITNLIINLDGKVDGAVIGVGGFLGMGEKEVAVAMDALVVTSSEPGEIQLVLNASMEELEAAPPFVDARDQQLDEQADMAQQQLQNEQQDAVAPAAPKEPGAASIE